MKQDVFVTRRFSSAIGDIYVHNLTAAHVERWFMELTEEHRCRDGRTRPPVSASSYNYYYARIKALMRYFQVRGWLRSDVMCLVEPRKVDRRQRLQPGKQALLKMLESTNNPRDRAILACAMNTGLRSNEISSLRVSDVDLSEQTLHVRITKSRLEDSMPMTLELANELRRWLTTYAEWMSTSGYGPLQSEHCLFPTRRTPRYEWSADQPGGRQRRTIDQGWDPTKPARKLHQIAQRALTAVGLPTKQQGIHTLRRAAARVLFDALVDERGYDGALRVTSSFLHHSNASTTETYLGLSSERRTRDDFLRGRSLFGWADSTPTNAAAVAPLPARRDGQKMPM